MQWNDSAIIVSVRRLGEHSGLVHLLTPQHGLHAGVDKGAFGKRKQGVYQPGNIVAAHWQARLTEHVGTLTCELTDAVASRLLDSRIKLAALGAATQMVERTLAERDPQPVIYDYMNAFLTLLCEAGTVTWLEAYVRLEYMLLECSGFGLDLSSCAATGQSHDLHYVSPKSGRAVSREAGLPYHERMLALPPFLREEQVDVEQIHLHEGLRLCGHFLNERVFMARGSTMPQARTRLVGALKEMESAL